MVSTRSRRKFFSAENEAAPSSPCGSVNGHRPWSPPPNNAHRQSHKKQQQHELDLLSGSEPTGSSSGAAGSSTSAAKPNGMAAAKPPPPQQQHKFSHLRDSVDMEAMWRQVAPPADWRAWLREWLYCAHVRFDIYSTVVVLDGWEKWVVVGIYAVLGVLALYGTARHVAAMASMAHEALAAARRA